MDESDAEIKPDVSMTNSEEVEAEEEKKPKIKREPEENDENAENEEEQSERSDKKRIQIRVVAQDAYEIAFKASMSTKMQKLMDAFAKHSNQTLNDLRFFFGDKRIQGEDTPGILGIEDDDEVEVHLRQDGGGHLF